MECPSCHNLKEKTMVNLLCLNVAENRTHRGGWASPDPSTISDLWRGAIIDHHRFTDGMSRILSRHEDVGAEGTFYPEHDELVSFGINLDALATCLDCGCITGAEVGDLVAQLRNSEITVEQFDDRVSMSLLPKGLTCSHEDALTAAAHMPSVLEAARFHPDDHLERALHAKGFCSCHVEYVS